LTQAIAIQIPGVGRVIMGDYVHLPLGGWNPYISFRPDGTMYVRSHLREWPRAIFKYPIIVRLVGQEDPVMIERGLTNARLRLNRLGEFLGWRDYQDTIEDCLRYVNKADPQ